jgi:ferredoxin-nitrite reductase
LKLNKIERIKQELAPSDFDIKSCDFSNLSESERFYLKNYGIYNIKLRPKNFMLRIRLDGGYITKTQLKELLELAKEHNLQMILTARASIELHNITAKNILQIYNLVHTLGLETKQSLTDNIRSLTTDVYDGVAKDSVIECYPIIKEIKKEFIDNRKYFGMLPRKFNATFIGRKEPLINPWGNDVVFALAKKNSIYGFNIYLGGKNTEVAQSANIFIEPQETKELFFAIVDSFIEYGLRQSRAKTRLFHLLEQIGMQKFREYIQEHFKKPLESQGKLLMQSSLYNLATPLKSNRFGNILKCHYGEVNLQEALMQIEDIKELRIGTDQSIHLFSSKELSNSKGLITACAGARYCPLSLWDIKNDIDLLSLEIFQKEQINIGFSGCLKGCGRHHHNHLGLVGLRSNMFGKTERAIRIFIGATELPNPTPARLLYYAVPERAARELFETIISEYKTKKYKDFYEFNALLNHYSIETLQLWFILRQLTSLDKKLIELFHSAKEKELLEELEKLPIYPKDKEAYEAVNILSHLLWDKKET